MCPFCLTTAALVAGSATGAGGGVTAFIARKFRKAKSPHHAFTTAKENHDGNRNAGFEEPQDRLAGRMDRGPQGIPR
jgi:hypothetical protein